MNLGKTRQTMSHLKEFCRQLHRDLSRPHWASLVGLGLFAGAFAFKMNVETIAWWPDLVRAIF